MLGSVNVQSQYLARTSPLLLAVGALNGEFQYGISPNISVGAGLLQWNVEILDVEMNVNSYHARLDYWTAGVFQQGWYLSGLALQSTFELSSTSLLSSTKYTGEVSGSGFGFGGGYHWQWESFNLELGAQMLSYSFDTTLKLKANDGTTRQEDIPAGTGLGAEFNMGWVF